MKQGIETWRCFFKKSIIFNNPKSYKNKVFAMKILTGDGYIWSSTAADSMSWETCYSQISTFELKVSITIDKQ